MSTFLKAVFSLTVCILVVASPAVRAWWVTNGVPVATLEGRATNPRAVPDGMGGAIIIMDDNYGGDPDIYGQRVSASGNIVWDLGGRMVCWVDGVQYYTVAVPDGAGGVIAAWQDERDGTFDIYIQRLNASGDFLWSMGGVGICTEATQDQEYLCIIADGAGGAIVAWRDGRNGNYDIYAQRVNSNGTALWAANGVALCTAAGTQTYPQAVSDGEGGVIVTWNDARNDANDIYVQRVDRFGSVRWTANGVALCTATGSQYAQQIATDGAGGAIVAWRDQRSFDNVYAQRVNSAGAVQWAANGIPLYATTDYQGSPHIVPDGAGGAIVAWYEYRKDEQGIFAQRVNGAGTRLWTAGGVIVEIGINELYDPWTSPDGLGGMIISWMDVIGEDFDLLARRLTPAGTFPWGKQATVLSNAIDNQRDASIASLGDGGAVIAWVDGRNGGYWEYDIYAQFVDGTGRVGWIAPEIASVSDVPGDQGGRVFLAWDAARPDRFMEDEMSHYTIWRSIDATQAALAVEGGAARIASLDELGPASAGSGNEALSGGGPVIRVDEMGALAMYWELVDTQEALFMEGYAKTEATLYDSSAACGDPTYFQVIAHTTDPRVYFKSAPDTGWSVDNLAPCPPVGFAGERVVVPAGLALTWEPNGESDFSCYALYRGTTADFVPGAGSLLGQLDETEYFDGEWNWGSGYFYKLSAFDMNGNESAFALFSPDDLTGVDTPDVPASTYLAQNFPNPFNPSTRIAFGLAAPAHVSLRIYDAAGRLVRVLIDEARQAGAFSEMWDGRDTRGAQVASGIYFYRLEAGSFAETRKMALLR